MGLFDSIRRVVGGDEPADADETAAGGPDADLIDTREFDVTALRRQAEGVAAEVEQLDFSLASLAQFDAAIEAGYDEELTTTDDPETYPRDAVRFGSYFGEVLVRAYGGRWEQDPEWGVTVSGDEDEATVAVFRVATRSITDDPVFAAVAERVAREVGIWADDGATGPTDDDASEGDAAPAADVADGIAADPPTDEAADPPTDEAAPDSEASQATQAGDTDESPAAEPTGDADADGSRDDSGSGTADPEWPAERGPRGPEAVESGSDAADEAATEADDPVSDGSEGPETGLGDESSARTAEASGEMATAGTDPDDVAALVEEAEPDAAGEPWVEEAEPDRPAPAEAADASGETPATDDTEQPASLFGGNEPDADPMPPAEESGDDAVPPADDAADAGPRPPADDPIDDGPEPPTDDAATAPDPTEGDGLRAEYAEEAEAFVAFWSEHDLDYSPESLSRLDELVAAEWDDDRFETATFQSDETFDDRAFTGVITELGSYFGEVLVRELDGEWSDETATDSVVVDGVDGQLAIPVFRVAETSLRKSPVFARSYDSLLGDLGRD